jgi:copper chaperone CopZ
MQTTTLISQEIECDGCANAIKKAVSKLEGVQNVTVDVPTQTVTIQHDEAIVPQPTLVATLDKAGFPVSH